MRQRIFFFAAGILFIIIGCDSGATTLISQNGQNKSHRTGQDCLSCHKSGGSGTGNFRLAGTIYQLDGTTPYANAEIQIWSGGQFSGDWIATVEADSKGNFYTTEPVEMNTGYFVSAVDDALVSHMAGVVNSGACNSCHNTTENRIRLN